MTGRVLCVFPTAWDERQLAAPGIVPAELEIELAGPTDGETPWDFDVAAFVDRQCRASRGRIAGVVSSSDYPGAAVAAAIATEIGLPGPRPEAVVRAGHKHRSRLAQRAVAPEAVPRFDRLDPDDPDTWRPSTGFPCFVKPVKGSFSVLARRIEDAAGLRALLASPEVADFRRYYAAMFAQLAERYLGGSADAGDFIAEELLTGHQVTVEGWTTRRGAGVLGVVDSVFHEGTRSFERFVYPSSLPAAVQERMADLARRVATGLGLEGAMFNVEMTWDPGADRIGIVEVNPRICGQFADLYQKVDGTNGYEVLLSLATGAEPRVRRRAGELALAGSFPLRVFEPSRVVRAPSEAEVRAVEAAHPGTLVWVECRTGDELADFAALEDGASCRYAVINLGGESREDLLARFEAVRDALGFELEPLGAARRPA